MAITLSNKTLKELEAEIHKEEKERAEQRLIPNKTVCDFEVLSEGTVFGKTETTREAQSKASRDKGQAGNNMIVLILKVFHESKEYIMADYLTSGSAKMAFKTNHAVAACGLTPEFDVDGNPMIDASDFIGKCGRLVMGVQKGSKKEGTNEYYSDKNSVSDYLPKVDVTVELDDEIPSF
jgi:uncharacterized protein YheU (UPF0270 family)